MPKEEKSRLRVFFADFEGSDTTIEGSDTTIKEGLKAIAEAVDKTFQAKTKIINVLESKGNQHALEVPETIVEEFEEEETKPIVKRKSRVNMKPASLSIVPDLNLFPKGKTKLREFYLTKKPKNHQEIITVFVYYLTKILNIKNINPNHIYTCYKDLADQKTPLNLPGTIRNTKSRKGWINTSNINDIKLEVKGENFVEFELPHEQHEQGRETE